MSKEAITIKPIGVIHTPYKTTEGIPIQGAFEEKITVEIGETFEPLLDECVVD